jgi:hypothetical protein
MSMNPLLEPASQEEHCEGRQGEDMRERRLRVTISYGMELGDLHLSRDLDDGLVRFELAPIQAICEASALDLEELVQGPQPLVGLLIARRRTGPGTGRWYGRLPPRRTDIPACQAS